MRPRKRAGGHAIGLRIGDRRQPRLAERAAHLVVGDVAQDLGDRLLDAAKPRAQLVGAARDLDMAVARLGGGALGDGDALLGGTLGRARRLARALGLAPRRFGHAALMRAGLLDAGLLGVAGGGEPARLGLDARLGLGVLGRDAVDLLADLGQPVALAEPHRRRRRRAGAHACSRPSATPRRRA